MISQVVIKPKQKLGKYRIERKLGDGGFATVFRAFDTVEGVRVALKVPYEHLLTEDFYDEFRREIRINAQLQHPNILPVKTADLIDDRLVVAYPLGERTLADRLRSRMSLPTAFGFIDQLLAAVAHAHSENVIHCDIKPENLILFPDGHLMLADFGLAKITVKTLRASGSGTVGYVAPEQAMGRPSFRSDVFSIGLVCYRMLAGDLPEWPYTWPPHGFHRLRAKAHPDLIRFLQRSIEVDPKKRFRDAIAMESAFQRIRPRSLRYPQRGTQGVGSSSSLSRDWRTVRRRQFLREFGTLLEADYTCPQCEGPVSEAMTHCPWCGDDRAVHSGETKFPQCCPRCYRGLKLDWSYCPWCYGSGFEVPSKRQYGDARYLEACSNEACSRGLLMPFMRYCPWCRTKVRQAWTIGDASEPCTGCGWGVLPGYWSHCAWCGKGVANASARR